MGTLKPNQQAHVAGMEEYALAVEQQQEFDKQIEGTVFDQKRAEETKDAVKHDESPESKNPEITEGMTVEQMDAIMKQLKNMVIMFEQMWRDSEREFKLTDSHMKQLYQWNEQHRIQMPEDLTDEEKDHWDHFNGLDSITEEEVLKIFGEGHPIIGVEHSQTKDRIHDVTEEFFNYLDAMRQYNVVNKAYLQAIEIKESESMKFLAAVAEKETDPEKKAEMQKSLDNYYYYKLLGFLADPLSEQEIQKLVKVYGDKKTIEYWLQRTRDKLKQAKINQKFIPEISQFEKRFLPQEYHCVSNILLLRFMQICTFASMGDPKDDDRKKVIMMSMTLDCTVRNIFSDDVRNQVLDNVKAFVDQLLEPLKEAYPKEVGQYKEDNEKNTEEETPEEASENDESPTEE